MQFIGRFVTGKSHIPVNSENGLRGSDEQRRVFIEQEVNYFLYQCSKGGFDMFFVAFFIFLEPFSLVVLFQFLKKLKIGFIDGAGHVGNQLRG
jgi:hypothetical protein